MQTYPIEEEDIDRAREAASEWLSKRLKVAKQSNIILAEDGMDGELGSVTVLFPYDDANESVYNTLEDLFPFIYSFTFDDEGERYGSSYDNYDFRSLNEVARYYDILFIGIVFYKLFQEGREINYNAWERNTSVPLDIEITFQFYSTGHFDDEDYDD